VKDDKKPIEGLGDIIQRLTKAVKIPTCSKCEERRKKLNAMFPLKKGQIHPENEPDHTKPESKEETGS